MTLKTFFRLPVIAFLITFCVLMGIFIYKLNFNPDDGFRSYYISAFIQILGFSLLILFVMSICVSQLNIYQVNGRNLLLVILLTALLIIVKLLWEKFFTLYHIFVIKIVGYEFAIIFYYLISFTSRIGLVLIPFLLVIGITKLLKSTLHWQDQPDVKITFGSEQIAKIQLIYFSVLFLAVSFIFAGFLYALSYMLMGAKGMMTSHYLSFYGASILLAWLFALFIKANNPQYQTINWLSAVKAVAFILVSQLILSAIVSLIMIFGVQSYFVFFKFFTNESDYINYIGLMYAMIYSIFVVAFLSCFITYFVGRFWLKRCQFLT